MIDFFLSASRIKGLLIALAVLLVLCLSLGAGIAVQTARLDAEQGRHEATAAKLAHEQTVSAILRDSTNNAHASISALQGQLRQMESSRVLEREQSAKREKVLHDVKQILANEAGVVDVETSRKAVEHINEALSRRARF